MTGITVAAGVAKPMPIEPPEGERMAVLMPITSPCKLNNGPPELPLLIDASVCRKSSYGPLSMLRLRAEMMPAVTVSPRPNGLPTAITPSPTRILSLSPNLTVLSGFSLSTLRTATSTLESLPMTLALSFRPSVKMTIISLASPTT